MSIGGRIFLGVVLIQLVSAALILGWFFVWVRAELDERTLQNAQQAVLRSIEETESYFRRAEAVTESARRLLAGDVLGREQPEELERYFFEQLRLRPQLAGLFVGYPDGAFFYVMRSDEQAVGGTRTKEIEPQADAREVTLTWRSNDYALVETASDPEDSYDPRTRTWYQAAAERREVAWTEPYIFFTSRKPGITSAAAVGTGDGSLEGVVGVDIELSQLSRFLTQIAFGLGGSAFVVAPGGEVIAHSSAELVLPDAAAGGGDLRFRKVAELPGVGGAVGDRIMARLSDPSGTSAPVVWREEAEGRDHFVALGRLSSVNWPWQIAVVVPEKGLVELAGGNDLILIGVILLASALACAVGYALSRSVGGAVDALHRNAKLARQGNYEIMEELQSGYPEIRETDQVLHELAEGIRGHGAPGAGGAKQSPEGGRDKP